MADSDYPQPNTRNVAYIRYVQVFNIRPYKLDYRW